jgi:hypothetical protein
MSLISRTSFCYGRETFGKFYKNLLKKCFDFNTVKLSSHKHGSVYSEKFVFLTESDVKIWDAEDFEEN